MLAEAYDPAKKSKANRKNINSLRYHLAVKKNSSIERLPPSELALKMHILRALWQINEWEQAILANISSFPVTEYGWSQCNEVLSPIYFEGNTAIEFLQKYFCNCSAKSSCSNNTCPCKELDLFCSEICDCSEKCENRKTIQCDDDEADMLEDSCT